MFSVQKWPFVQLFFLGNIGEEIVFYDTVARKNAFLGYKNKKFKKSKNRHFSKRITHGFGQNMDICPTSFFLGNIGQKKIFYDILARKNAFLGYKNNNFFFLRQYTARKCLLRYSRTKKCLSRL